MQLAIIHIAILIGIYPDIDFIITDIDRVQNPITIQISGDGGLFDFVFGNNAVAVKVLRPLIHVIDVNNTIAIHIFKVIWQDDVICINHAIPIGILSCLRINIGSIQNAVAIQIMTGEFIKSGKKLGAILRLTITNDVAILINSTLPVLNQNAILSLKPANPLFSAIIIKVECNTRDSDVGCIHTIAIKVDDKRVDKA